MFSLFTVIMSHISKNLFYSMRSVIYFSLFVKKLLYFKQITLNIMILLTNGVNNPRESVLTTTLYVQFPELK